MLFNKHSELTGKHAFLSPSNYHWVNYDLDKVTARFHTWKAAKRGTDLHKLAHDAIKLGIFLDVSHDALALYVADGIHFGMECEVLLHYSELCFGEADCISFEDDVLRISDLKTGVAATSFKQLEVYAALFCLEYGYDPFDIDIILRIYQREEVRVHDPEPEGIAEIMEKIIRFDEQIETIKER